MKNINIFEDVLIGLGLTVSISDLQNFLSVILLIFNIMWILIKFGVRVYNHIKNKDYASIEKDVKETKEELEKLKNKSQSMKEK